MTGFKACASGCCSRSSEGHLGLRVVMRIWRSNEWLVEPGHQIAVGEEIHAQKRQD